MSTPQPTKPSTTYVITVSGQFDVMVIRQKVIHVFVTGSVRTSNSVRNAHLQPRYLNIVIKLLCSNLDIFLSYYFRSRNSIRVLSVADCNRSEISFFGWRFSVSGFDCSSPKTRILSRGGQTRLYLIMGTSDSSWVRIALKASVDSFPNVLLNKMTQVVHKGK